MQTILTTMTCLVFPPVVLAGDVDLSLTCRVRVTDESFRIRWENIRVEIMKQEITTDSAKKDSEKLDNLVKEYHTLSKQLLYNALMKSFRKNLSRAIQGSG